MLLLKQAAAPYGCLSCILMSSWALFIWSYECSGADTEHTDTSNMCIQIVVDGLDKLVMCICTKVYIFENGNHVNHKVPELNGCLWIKEIHIFTHCFPLFVCLFYISKMSTI